MTKTALPLAKNSYFNIASRVSNTFVAAQVGLEKDGTSDLSLRMHYSRRTGFILVVMI